MDRLMKDAFLSTISKNTHNSYNKQFIMNHAEILIDAIQSMECSVHFVPTYKDSRFLEIRNNVGNVCGQIFATKDKFNSYWIMPDFYLNYNVDKRKNEDMYIRKTIYKQLELADSQYLQNKTSNLCEENKEFAVFEFKDKTYFSNRQFECTETFSNNYLNISNTTISSLILSFFSSNVEMVVLDMFK